MLSAEEVQYPSLFQDTSSPQEAYELEQAIFIQVVGNHYPRVINKVSPPKTNAPSSPKDAKKLRRKTQT